MDIKELKNLAMAYRLALEWDICPNDSADEEIASFLGVDDTETIDDVIAKYCGLRPDEIVDRIIMAIESEDN